MPLTLRMPRQTLWSFTGHSFTNSSLVFSGSLLTLRRRCWTTKAHLSGCVSEASELFTGAFSRSGVLQVLG